MVICLKMVIVNLPSLALLRLSKFPNGLWVALGASVLAFPIAYIALPLAAITSSFDLYLFVFASFLIAYIVVDLVFSQFIKRREQ